MKDIIKLENSWLNELEDELYKPYMKELKQFLLEEINKDKQILPKSSLWFNALNSTPLHKVKVVILGQDPYPTNGHPHGLCFPVSPEIKHLIIKSPHPSPLSAYRGFFGSKPFSKTNNYLSENNKKIINWGLKNE